MNILQLLLADDLRELKGFTMQGKIPLDPALINQVIATFLDSGAAPGVGQSGNAASTPPSIDFLSLLRRHLKQAEIAVEDGRIILYFDIQVE